MQELTQGQGVWRRHPSTDEFTTFQMHSLTHLAKLCQSVEVPMLDSEEQVQQRLRILLPKVKFGNPDEPDDETDNEVPVDTPNASDLEVPSSST